MANYLPLLAALVALLVGLLVGKAWERYKLRDGRWIDRRRLRETPHYMLGLNFLTEHQVDQAIEELTAATSSDTDALEIQMILGNLYRQKGQVARAITVHQGLLQRTNLTRLEHAYVLLCLGLDFRHGGFVDRALEAFQEVVQLDPENRYALVNQQKLHEDQQQWADAARVRAQIARIDGQRRGDNQQILGFLRNQLGTDTARTGNTEGRLGTVSRSPRHRSQDGACLPSISGTCTWSAAIRQPRSPLGKGSCRPFPSVPIWRSSASSGRTKPLARRSDSSRSANSSSHAIRRTGGPVWRSPAITRPPARRAIAFDLLLASLPHNPHGLVVHQEIWRALLELGLNADLVRRYVALTRDAVFYLDPHVCTHCPVPEHRSCCGSARSATSGIHLLRNELHRRRKRRSRELADMKRVALTGGIATGKSHVRAVFAALGVPTIDADVLARDAVAPGSAGFEAVKARFGPGVLDSTGGLTGGNSATSFSLMLRPGTTWSKSSIPA
jgi:tetratricopeptide (TPR) repeat protein